jgi:hypothetical protein
MIIKLVTEKAYATYDISEEATGVTTSQYE